MRQRGDLLNNVRMGDTQPCDIGLLESRVIKPHKIILMFLQEMQV